MASINGWATGLLAWGIKKMCDVGQLVRDVGLNLATGGLYGTGQAAASAAEGDIGGALARADMGPAAAVTGPATDVAGPGPVLGAKGAIIGGTVGGPAGGFIGSNVGQVAGQFLARTPEGGAVPQSFPQTATQGRPLALRGGALSSPHPGLAPEFPKGLAGQRSPGMAQLPTESEFEMMQRYPNLFFG